MLVIKGRAEITHLLHKYVNFFDIALFDVIASVMGIVRFGMGI